jgi:uncharacterized protein YkwD
MKKHTFIRIFITAAVVITLTAGGAAVFAHEKNGTPSLTVDGQSVNLRRPVHAENQNAYISVDDIFDYFGFDRQTNHKTGISAYVSPDTFFTVDHETLALKINGTPSAVALKPIDQQWFIHAKDLIHILPVTSAYNQAMGELQLTTGWDADIVLHLDGVKTFPLKGSFKIANNQAWIGVYTLPNVLLESEVLINADSLEIKSPLDGSYTKFKFDGTLEYRPAGAGASVSGVYDKAAMLNGAGDNLRLNTDLISKYSSYVITCSQRTAKPSFDIYIKSAWNDARRPADAAALPDEPAGAVYYEPPAADIHPGVRDAGYVLHTTLMDDIAAEINRLRTNAGLSPLPVNHSLIYKKQNDAPGRTTAFDNLRWCREYLSGRTLEHLLPAPYMSEILMSEFKSGISASMIVNLWNASPVHKAILSNPNQQEFGVGVIQYSNGDLDVVGAFLSHS